MPETFTQETVWYGDMSDGTTAPLNSDKARLDWMSLHQKEVKNLKAGVRVVGIEVWQPGLRPAIDAAMEKMRRELRAAGLNPIW